MVKIALGQVSAAEDREQNIMKAFELIEEAAEMDAKLICFPEMGFDIFFPQVIHDPTYFALGEPIPGPTTERLQEQARANQIAIVCNIYEKAAPGIFYDASPVIDTDGTLLGKQRMMHIAEFRHYNEKYYYKPGNSGYPVFETEAVNIGVAICYDRHYPEQIRLLTLAGAQIIVLPTATSTAFRGLPWETEIQAASIAKGVFIAVCNRVGIEDEITFFGHSFVTNPFGEVIVRASEDQEELLFADVDLELIDQARERWSFLRDRRPDTYGDLSRDLL